MLTKEDIICSYCGFKNYGEYVNKKLVEQLRKNHSQFALFEDKNWYLGFNCRACNQRLDIICKLNFQFYDYKENCKYYGKGIPIERKIEVIKGEIERINNSSEVKEWQ